MPFFTLFRKNKKQKKTGGSKVTNKLVDKAGQHAQQHIQNNAADYSDRLGSRAEGYANRYDYTREHASRIRDVSTQGAAVGLGVAGQYAADRQASQYRTSNSSSNNIGTGTAQAPRRSAWERPLGSRPSQPGYGSGLSLSTPQQAASTTRLQHGNRTGPRNHVPSSQDAWYESRNIIIGGGQGESLVVQKDPARARRVNQY